MTFKIDQTFHTRKCKIFCSAKILFQILNKVIQYSYDFGKTFGCKCGYPHHQHGFDYLGIQPVNYLENDVTFSSNFTKFQFHQIINILEK